MPGATVEEETVIEQQEPSQETDEVELQEKLELREGNIKTETLAEFSGGEGDSGGPIQTVTAAGKLVDVQGIRVEDMMNENHAETIDSQLMGELNYIL